MSQSDPFDGLRRTSCRGIDLLIRPGDKARSAVFLHGIGSRAQSWTRLFAEYPAGPQLIAWDAPGYGGSHALDVENPDAHDYAMCLDALLDALPLTSVDVVGHSLGCLVAGEFAHMGSARVSRLALVSPALGYGVARTEPLPAAHAARIADLERLGPEQFAKERAARLVYEADGRPDVVADVQSAMATMTLPGYAQAVRLLAGGELVARARYMEVPTLIVNGREDVVTPPDGATRLAAAWRNSRLELISEAGHALPQESPVRLAALLAAHFGVES